MDRPRRTNSWHISKVDGNKITLKKIDGVLKKGEKSTSFADLTYTAADSCKVFKARFNEKTDKVEVVEALEDGLNNKLFNKAAVLARITTQGDKVTEVAILRVTPTNDFMAFVTKIDGNKVTYRRFGRKAAETTLTVAAGLKVTEGKFNMETRKVDVSPLEGGLKNPGFARAGAIARFLLNDDDHIIELRLLPGEAPPPAR